MEFYTLISAALFIFSFQLSPVEPVPVSGIQSSISDNGSLRLKREAPSTDLNRKWPNNTVYYEIDDGLSSIREDVERAMHTVQNVSCIRYVRRTNQIDYVRFQHNTTRCYEPVGRQGGLQSIYIHIPECGNFGFYVHASMQLLGFYHEHQRFDRDDYITLYPENIQPEWLWAFDKLNATSHYYNSTYDLDSIMQYGSYQFSKNGQPAILTKSGSLIESWDQKSRLSPLDIAAINEYYNCSKH